MNKFKFTGVNIAAAFLIVGFFLPWVQAMQQSMSGFSIFSNGISPGMLSRFISGTSRLFMVLSVIVPLSAAIILYQNVTGNNKFARYRKTAHFLPFIYLLLGIIFLYFKMKPDVSGSGALGSFQRSISEMAPGAFDIMSFGVYASLAAALYLALVEMGKIKDKEYYKPAADITSENQN